MQQDKINPTTIIFDFDGTIADSLALIIEIFHTLVPGHDDASDEQIEALRNLSVRHIADAIGVPMWKVPFLVWRGRKIMRGRLDEVMVFPGLPEVFEKLRSNGYPLHIVSSNSTENVQTYISKQGLTDSFKSITGGVGLFGKKRAIQKLCKTYNTPLDRVWYVGDEVRDVVAAKKAGVRVVAVGWGFNHPNILSETGPDALVMTPAELLKTITAKQD